jgi:L-alanine-DL-glutamate epimerase-like enolase superfamily enzyme
VTTWDRLAALSLEIEGYSLEGLELALRNFDRLTTVVHLRGGGEEGLGEDVTYGGLDHVAFRTDGLDLPLAGSWTLGEFSALLGELPLFPEPPEYAASEQYRRWAFESAALDLALRQAGQSLAAVLERTPRPVTYVVSMGLGEPSSMEPLERLLERYPGTRLKLDPKVDWDDAFCGPLVATGAVDSVDLKGHYVGTPVDLAADPELYRRVAEAFPDAWIEDPKLTPETDAVLLPHRGRITWDAPIHSVADIEALPFPPRMVNIKPSRFGTLEALCDAYEWCEAHGVQAYGGGQTELGVGRGQIQYLASLFHPDTPNDVAPKEFNNPQLPDGLEQSPLQPAAAPVGFRWGD